MLLRRERLKVSTSMVGRMLERLKQTRQLKVDVSERSCYYPAADGRALGRPISAVEANEVGWRRRREASIHHPALEATGL